MRNTTQVIHGGDAGDVNYELSIPTCDYYEESRSTPVLPVVPLQGALSMKLSRIQMLSGTLNLLSMVEPCHPAMTITRWLLERLPALLLGRALYTHTYIHIYMYMCERRWAHETVVGSLRALTSMTTRHRH